jgi:hypothetical protein
MHWSEKALIWLLRIFAVVLLTALIPVIMPYAWMNAIHRWLGMGELPQAPIVGYLTRSCSALYAYHGAIVGFLSIDVRRYLPVIRCLLWLAVAFGVVVFGIDVAVGMPFYWIIGEGPVVVVLSAALLWLVRITEQNLAD